MLKFKNLPLHQKIYFFSLILVLIDRYLLLSHFGFRFVGSDDTIFWLGAHDYLHGEFYTPYFYGQDYNFMLESIFAVPLLALNVPYYIALPLSTSFVTLFPFFMFSYVLLKRGYVVESMIFLLIPLTLPIEYGILSSTTRGFASGLFFCGFLVFPILEPHKKSSWVICALATSLGYFVNPSSVIFSLPVNLFILFQNFHSIFYYLIYLACALPVFITEHYAKQFVLSRHDYNCHPFMKLEFKWEFMTKNLDKLDNYFSYFTPVTWFAGWLGLVLIFLIGLLLFKQDKRKSIVLMIGVLFIFLSLGVNKIHDHLDTIFLTSARMYLCIPLFFGLACCWGRKLLNTTDQSILIALTGAAISIFLIKVSLLDQVIDRYTLKKNYGAVAIKKVDDLCKECDRIKDSLAVHPADLVLFSPSWKFDYNVPQIEFYNYACPLLEKNFPPTLINMFERRAWVLNKEKKTVAKTILFYNPDIDLDLLHSLKNCKILTLQDPKMFVLTNNSLTTDSLMRSLRLPLWGNPADR